MRSRSRPKPNLRRSVARHYDSLALLYRTFWGEHIHHGLWLQGDSPPAAAQEKLVSHLAASARVHNRERILDVGCGYGASGRWLSRRLDASVLGITISRKQADLASRYNVRAGLASKISVVRADAAALPLADASFDVVWVVECMEHLEDKRRFLHDAARILRPGGRFALCAWQRGAGASLDDRLLRQICEAFLCPSLASMEEQRRWCEEEGLEVRRAEDLTAHVRRTWDVLIARLGRPWLAPLRLLAGRDTRRFLAGFPLIRKAYDSGAMSYGLLIAAKPRPGSDRPEARTTKVSSEG